MKRKRIHPVFVLLGFIPLVIYYVYMEWGYLPFQEPDFSKNFNEERLRIGVPVLEDYFIDKTPDWEKRKVWVTPDSSKNQYLHISKLYWTERGNITYEYDFYSLRKTQPTDTVLKRVYNYIKDTTTYELSVSRERTVVYNKQLNQEQSDSLLSKWSERLNNYNR